MKILHITDSHATMKAPESRQDIYYLAFLKKMYELKYVIKNENIDVIVHTGDLFHGPKISDKFAGQLADIIRSYKIPMYVVPGNHDIMGYNIDTVDQTKLGLLFKTGVIKELDRNHPIQLTSASEDLVINLSGQEYYKDIDTGIDSDYEMQVDTDTADINILCIHGYLCDKPQNPNIPHTLCKDVITDADVILSGHFHESFKYESDYFNAYNPGSLMRVERNTYNKTHIPQYGILTISKEDDGDCTYSYSFRNFKVAQPSKEVFDYEKAVNDKQTLISLDNFKNSIANTNLNDDLSLSIEDIISNISHNMNINDEDLIDNIIDYYNDTVNNESEEMKFVQDGYISDINRKHISAVEIHNFQSHKDTTVTFDEGLNVIVGNSNSGKTAILRAIRWVIDNYPLGSDFITTGEDECSVTLYFNDGTYITRTRTRNDAGSYHVHGKNYNPDGSVNYWDQTYKGFANNLPIEIANVHQMPKVDLLPNDMSLHLNMMNQLDGPFLIADSAAVKANVIGRLTGTQNIDMVIKKANAASTKISHSIKTLEKENKKREEDLSFKEEDINDYKAKAEAIDDFCEHFFAVKDLATIVYSAVGKIIESNDKIKVMQDSLGKLSALQRSLIWCFEVAKRLRSTLLVIKSLNTYIEKKNALDKSIKYKALYDEADKIHNFVSTATEKIRFGIDIIKKYEKYVHTKDRINTIKSYLDNYNDVIQNVNVIKDIIENRSKGLSIGISYNNKNQRLKELRVNIVEIENTITDYTHDKEDLIKEQLKVFNENDLCPCCGQKLRSDDRKLQVLSFMKGR